MVERCDFRLGWESVLSLGQGCLSRIWMFSNALIGSVRLLFKFLIWIMTSAALVMVSAVVVLADTKLAT